MKSGFRTLRTFIPPIAAIRQLYAVQVFSVYSWTVLDFFFDLPRWRLFLSPLELGALLAYALVFAFLESVAFLFVVLVPGSLAYRTWLRDSFVPVASAVSVSGYAWLGLFWLKYQQSLRDSTAWMVERFPAGVMLALMTTALFAFLVQRIAPLRNLWSKLADSAQVFFYIYIPVTLLAAGVLLIRNWK